MISVALQQHQAPTSSETRKRDVDHFLSGRPIIGYKEDCPAGFINPFHSHMRSQLLFARSGVMTVVTENYTYAVPPQRCLWIDAGVQHEVTCRNKVSVRTLYLKPEIYQKKGVKCRLFEVSEFLQALILEIVYFDYSKPIDERQLLAIRLLLMEIENMPDAPYSIPMPKDERLLEVCHLLIEKLNMHQDLDELAALVCMSRRGFTRRFRMETNMSFGAWRRQMRLTEAISMIESGQSIKKTAYELGYNSPSAFTAAFRKTFGAPPTRYRLFPS